MDVVYILGNGSQCENEELRLSLRSLEANCKFDRVIIVGEHPSFLENVSWVPFKEKGNPRVNHLEKVNEVIEAVPDLSENFVLMYDDIFFIKSVDFENYPNYYKGQLEKCTNGNNLFNKCLGDTKAYLESIGATTYNFSVHTPVIYNKTLWKQIDWSPVYEAPEGLSPRCIYGNLKCKNPVKCEDCKYEVEEQIKPYDRCFSVVSNKFKNFTRYLRKKFDMRSSYEELFDNLTQVKDFIANKRVAIVGNAESIFSKSNGSLIDQFDVVIRFNRGFITKPESQGTRTDILIMACELTEEERKSYGAKIYINRMNRFRNPTPLHFQNVDIKYIGREIEDARASSGFIAINLCVAAKAKSIDLFGFDWEETPTFYNPADYHTLHNYADEKSLVFSKFKVKVN